MTQENTPVSEEKNQISSDLDKSLIFLIDMADKSAGDVDIRITLFVQGLIVSGVLISEKLYFEGLYSELNLVVTSSNIQEEKGQTLLKIYQSFAAKISGDREVKKQVENTEYIHLKNVAFYSGNFLTPNNANNRFISNNKGGYWRGNLNRIDGFCMGDITKHN